MDICTGKISTVNLHNLRQILCCTVILSTCRSLFFATIYSISRCHRPVNISIQNMNFYYETFHWIIFNIYIFTLERYTSVVVENISIKYKSMYLFSSSVKSFFVLLVASTLSVFSPPLSFALSVFFSSLSEKFRDNFKMSVKSIILSVVHLLTIDVYNKDEVKKIIIIYTWHLAVNLWMCSKSLKWKYTDSNNGCSNN